MDDYMTEKQKQAASEEKKREKAAEKAYEKYASAFTPKPTYVSNCVKAFVIGGLICAAGAMLQEAFLKSGIAEKEAGSLVSIILIAAAQLLTGLGVFDSIAKFAGAGVIVPITGFANSMVAPAIEYKKEGIVLGVGAKLFSLAGPVLVCGITLSAAVGMIYWAAAQFSQ